MLLGCRFTRRPSSLPLDHASLEQIVCSRRIVSCDAGGIDCWENAVPKAISQFEGVRREGGAMRYHSHRTDRVTATSILVCFLILANLVVASVTST